MVLPTFPVSYVFHPALTKWDHLRRFISARSTRPWYFDCGWEPQKCGGYLRRPHHHHHHQNLQIIWNVQFITIFVPVWMIPPVYHSLRRESKTTSSASPIGVQSVRPTWFEDTTPKDTASQPEKEQPQPTARAKVSYQRRGAADE